MTLKTFALAAAVILATAVPAAAADSMCAEPIAPAALDGNTATADQIHSGLADVKTFLKQSDDYQDCLWREFTAAKATATKEKKELDPSVEAGVRAKVQENQSLKEKVGAEFNAAAIAFNNKHKDK